MKKNKVGAIFICDCGNNKFQIKYAKKTLWGICTKCKIEIMEIDYMDIKGFRVSSN